MTQPFLLQEQAIIPTLAEGFCSSSSLWPPGHGGDVFSWPRRRRDEKRHFWVSNHDSKPLCHLRLLRPRLSSTHLTENAFAAKCHSASASVCSDSSYKFVICGCDVQVLLLFSLFHHHNCCIIIKRLKSSFIIQGADYFSIQMVEDSLALCLTRDAELWSLRQLSHHNCPPLEWGYGVSLTEIGLDILIVSLPIDLWTMEDVILTLTSSSKTIKTCRICGMKGLWEEVYNVTVELYSVRGISVSRGTLGSSSRS